MSFSAEKANKDSNLDDLVKLKRKIASQQGELRSLRSENTKLIKQIDNSNQDVSNMQCTKKTM